jgi:NTP pyrophosphatase (non-canonical NTP hydrolase)
LNGDKQHAVWRESIRKYGKETQSIVCMEECSELIQAISKRLRGKPDATDNLAEEMADVTICLHLLQEMYGITDKQVDTWIARKTFRQFARMKADDPFMESEDTK